MKSLFGLEKKRILVLGGGQGMGEATVRLLAKLGCHVAIADREPDRAERVAAEIAGDVAAFPIGVDVLDDGALVAAIAKAERDFGPLDGMVTIIGMAEWSPLIELGIDAWDNDHRRNLRYVFIAARELAKILLKRRAPGSIVCVGSISGARSAASHASYGAAKAGLMNLIQTMAVEWAPHRIRANVVAPGSIVTPRMPDAGGKETAAGGGIPIPLGRRGSVEEIAKAIVFLLSDMASYVTGQTLVVDGGFMAAFPTHSPSPAMSGGKR